MQKIIKLILILPLLLLMTAIHAETTQYNIEVIIFEDSSNRYLNSEQWPVIHHPETTLSTALNKSESGLFHLENYDSKIENKQLQHPSINSVINITYQATDLLADYVIRLDRSSRYNVLLHQSWQQAGLSDTNAIKVAVDSSASANTADNFNLSHQIPSNDNKKLKSQIKGSLKLILGRYLHMHVDLLYKRPDTSYKQASPTLNSKVFNEFKISAQRRMRSNELHYIDHALVGILVLVNPIKRTDTINKNNESDLM